MAGKNKIPGNWSDFLSDPTNKQELFSNLSTEVSNINVPHDKEIVCTSGTSVIQKGNSHPTPICDHEEADTRLIVHVQDAVKNGSRTCLVRIVDTDVIVILAGKFYFFKTQIDIWVAFGAGKHLMYYHNNYICHM